MDDAQHCRRRTYEAGAYLWGVDGDIRLPPWTGVHCYLFLVLSQLFWNFFVVTKVLMIIKYLNYLLLFNEIQIIYTIGLKTNVVSIAL